MVKQQSYTESPEKWIDHVAKTRGEGDIALLKSAMDLDTGKNPEFLKSGLGIANILLAMDLDSETLAAAIIYPAVRAHDIHPESVAERFGDKVKKMLIDAQQMQSLERFGQFSQREENQTENLRKILLAMVTDIRAVLIILAERLMQLRLAKSLDATKQQQLATQSLKIYAPLANRLGVWQLKWEIEDMCLRYLEPDMYKAIATGIASKRDEREQYLKQSIAALTDVLQKHHLNNFTVTGRIKHIYSIFSKMRRKNAELDKIYDISAMRVLVPTIDDCYNTVSILHHTWKPFHDEFDDYISKPKANGYQSIHTVIYGPENRMIEVQIRTYKMHEDSELGVASHWRYKENVKSSSQYEEKIALLRHIMAWQKEISVDVETKAKAPVKDIFADRVYVFTPLGDIIDLPQGATPLDFAYAVHSEVGHRCRGAKVDGKMVTLTYTLKTGERVEIMTTKIASPSRDWLNPHKGYLKTMRARSHVQHWFKAHDVPEKIEVQEPKIKQRTKPERPATPVHTVSSKVTPRFANISTYLTKFAKCCKPLPGDNVIGYITQKQGLSIHRLDCINIAYLRQKFPERFLELGSNEKYSGTFPVDLEITANKTSKLLNMITSTLANAGFHIIAISERSTPSNTATSFMLSINIADMNDLTKITKLLTHINDVIEVRRL